MKLESPLVCDPNLKIPSLFEAVTGKMPIVEQPEPPPELVKYRMLGKFDKARAGDEFFRKEEIAEYLETKWKRELHNRTCFQWLVELKAETTDCYQLQVINNKLKEFAKVIKSTRNACDALLVDVSEYV
jgi:hypothetical protein